MKQKVQNVLLVVLGGICFGTGTVQAQHSWFFGVSKHGGAYNCGTIFKTDCNGENAVILHDFQVTNQGTPRLFCEADNGKIYGIANVYAQTGDVLFEWDPSTDEYTVKAYFNGTENGDTPGTLMCANNGKLYGMTFSGGIYDCGVLFEYDPSNDIFTKKLDFNGAGNGGWPLFNSLIQADNGRLYGTTNGGGANGDGVLFEWDPETDTYTKRMNFDNAVTGASPENSLVQAANGMIYGTTRGGGANGLGVFFRWDPETGTFANIMDFKVGESEPRGGTLTRAASGMLYGLSSSGGTDNKGLLFEFDPDNELYSIKFNFNGTENGDSPKGLLLQSDNGKLYGMTNNGGLYDCGVLFEWDPLTESFLKKLDFREKETGKNPRDLIQTSGGSYFGLIGGGVYEHGLLYEWDPETDDFDIRLEFNVTEFGTYPQGSLLEAANGKLYGTTNGGGIHGAGVLFEWSPIQHRFTKLFDLQDTASGRSPDGALVEAGNGKLYGMTNDGGIYGAGVLYEWDPAKEVFTKKMDFNGEGNGAWSFGSLVQAASGMLYGMTPMGGLNNDGVLFEWDPETDTYTKKLDFSHMEQGGNPCGSLVEASNGKLYGMTCYGGTHDGGVIFTWDPFTDTYEKQFDFNRAENGASPWASLAEGDDGKLYGMTEKGGENDCGVLFSWDPVENKYRKLVDFDWDGTGGEPRSTPMKALNGKIYGTTQLGGAFGNGTLFEWDPVTEVFLVKYYFSEYDIRKAVQSYAKDKASEVPEVIMRKAASVESEDTDESEPDINISGCYGLIEVLNLSFSYLDISACGSYTAPSGATVWTTSGTYVDTILNATGGDSILTIQLTILTVDTTVTQKGAILTSNAENASYQWIDCDNGSSIEGATQQSYAAGSDGSYAVIVTQNECVDTSSCYVVNTTNLDGNSLKPDISLSPNPVDGSFSLDLGKAYAKVGIKITATDGRTILKEERYNTEFIQLSFDASPGIYVVTVTTANERTNLKVVRK